MAGNVTTTFYRLFETPALPTCQRRYGGTDFRRPSTPPTICSSAAFNNPLHYNAALDFNGDGIINSAITSNSAAVSINAYLAGLSVRAKRA
jgi:hypothetical protein